MRTITNFNAGWTFFPAFSADLIEKHRTGTPVCLPHNAVDLELNYFDEKAFQKAFTYQKVVAWQPEFQGKEVSLVFDGAMADAVVWINGSEAGAHKDGYTPFEIRLTDDLVPGENLITVKIDGTENPEIPPFGGQIDYLTYAGIYRDVWLKVTDAVSIRNIKVETADELSDAKRASVRCTFANPRGLKFSGTVQADLCGIDGRVLQSVQAAIDGSEASLHFENLSGLALWELDNPQLYVIKLTANTEHGSDALSTRFGFRTARFTPEGFLLNGRPLKIRGLNRHQSFPYVGYAMGRRAQEKDADLVKKMLKCNLVRTSHYPQSPYFLDRCDEIGLLVFEEIPGWQYIGGEIWQNEAVENVRRMVERDWNHPSIILWGVRINESPDDHEFYVRTNQMAHSLDSTRQTGGVRCIENSEYLEDVYTMNDFINRVDPPVLDGNGPRALREPRAVTGLDVDVPYMVTEFNGHMYPTKRIDPERRQAEHVTRYLQVLDKSYTNPKISGSIGWCMADYNTHNDFGAGDRICHHGVLDIYREPKFAAYVYASQCEPAEQVILEPVTYWARGEKDRCEVLPLIVLTNCDHVEFQFGDFPAKRVEPDRALYPNLPHAPVIIDGRHVGINELGEWGMRWLDGKITGFVGGKPVAEVRLSGNPLPTTLEVEVDDLELVAHEKDATRVIVRALDQAGRVLPFIDDVVCVEVTGPAKLLGPRLLPFKGGIVGFWIETTGEAGKVSVRVAARRFSEQTLSIDVS